MDLKELERMTLEQIAEDIESMDIRGAAAIGRAAVIALRNEIQDFEGTDEELNSLIDESRERLLSTRPTAVSLRNAIRYVLKDGQEDLGTEERREKVVSRANEFVERSLKAGRLIAEYGGKRISSGDTILTHCNSSMALGCIKHAWEKGKDIEVIATESRPKRQGYITVRELSEVGIPVTLIVDSAVRFKMQKVDQVYVGADTIASNGAVINKIGTSQVALCADEARVPVAVCAETYKFSRETAFGDLVKIEERNPEEIVDPEEFKGVNISNPVFDATPPEYIDCIVTEKGIISPEGAYRMIREME